jgi:two-component system cell cycle sensor histidine kinase/response regulator CckA
MPNERLYASNTIDLVMAETIADYYAVGAIDRGEELDLLLSDVVMPVMRGPDVAARLRVRRPALKVLFISGYADTLATDVTGTAVTDPILTKPFTPDQLLSAVRAVLAR